jgi:hypothetical protein
MPNASLLQQQQQLDVPNNSLQSGSWQQQVQLPFPPVVAQQQIEQLNPQQQLLMQQHALLAQQQRMQQQHHPM